MCENTNCGVHFRTNYEEVSHEEEFVAKITYVGEWAIFTADNSFIMYTALLGKPELVHMTLLIKVGDKPLGDFLDTGLTDHVYDGYLSTSVESAIESHNMVTYGVESGLLTDFATPIKPIDLVLRYAA